MTKIATFVFIDMLDDKSNDIKEEPMVSLLALRRNFLEKRRDIEDYYDISLYDYVSHVIPQQLADFIKPLDKPVCLVSYNDKSSLFIQLRQKGYVFDASFPVMRADAMPACYDILGVNNDETESCSLRSVYHRVTGEQMRLGGPSNRVMAIARIVLKLSDRFVKWFDANHHHFLYGFCPVCNSYTICDLDVPRAGPTEESGEATVYLQVAACRQDGIGVDRALATLIIKKLNDLVLRELDRVNEGPQFNESKLVDGYTRITAATTASKGWLLSQDFGQLGGHSIVLKTFPNMLVRILGAPGDIPEESMVLQYIRGQNWDKPELELDKWLLVSRVEYPWGINLNFSVPFTVERVWGDDDVRKLFLGCTTVPAKIIRLS